MHVIIWYMSQRSHAPLEQQITECLKKDPKCMNEKINFLFHAPAPEDTRRLQPLAIYITAEWIDKKSELKIISSVADVCCRYCREQKPPIQFGGYEIQHLAAMRL